jgi:hypothetical protein
MEDLLLNDLAFEDKGKDGVIIHFGIEMIGELSAEEAGVLEEWLEKRNLDTNQNPYY